MSLNDKRPKPYALPPTPAANVSSPEGQTAERRERRADPRAPLDQPATVKILHPRATLDDRVDGRVVNLSRSGLKLRVASPMLPGSMVQVRFMERIALGEIRYCIPTGPDYYVGVRFQDVMEMP